MTLLLKLAFRNIFRQRRRSLLTAFSIGGGYLLCVLSISMIEGSYNNLITLFTLTKTGHLQVHQGNYLQRPKLHLAIADYEAVGRKIADHPEVQSTTYRVFTPALAYSDEGNYPARVIGIDVELEPRTTLIADKPRQGEFIQATPDDDGIYSAMIGHGIAESLKIGPGDELILIAQAADGSVANDIFKVSALIGGQEPADKATVYLPLGAAQQFLALEAQVHEIVVVLDRYQRSQPVAQQLAQQLPSLTVSPWQRVEQDFYTSMQSDKQGNQVMLGIILFIVFIGVLNTVLMSVLERTREFGVLKAIGSRPGHILAMVCLETLLLATMSVIMAFIVAVPITYWFATTGFELAEPIDVGGIAFSAFRGEISAYVFGAPFVLLIGFALIVSLPPGLRAARIVPGRAMSSN